jgi:hypothetical protein
LDDSHRFAGVGNAPPSYCAPAWACIVPPRACVGSRVFACLISAVLLLLPSLLSFSFKASAVFVLVLSFSFTASAASCLVIMPAGCGQRHRAGGGLSGGWKKVTQYHRSLRKEMTKHKSSEECGLKCRACIAFKEGRQYKKGHDTWENAQGQQCYCPHHGKQGLSVVIPVILPLPPAHTPCSVIHLPACPFPALLSCPP